MSLHVPCTHHSDGVVEESLSEYDDVDLLVDADVLKHVQGRHRVHGRDDGGEQQVLLWSSIRHKIHLEWNRSEYFT